MYRIRAFWVHLKEMRERKKDSVGDREREIDREKEGDREINTQREREREG